VLSKPFPGQGVEQVFGHVLICKKKGGVKPRTEVKTKRKLHKKAKSQNRSKRRDSSKKRLPHELTPPNGKANPSRTTWLHSRAFKSAQVHVVTPLVAARPTPWNFIPADSLERVQGPADRSQFESLQI
jgi:hypothetical protein